jgi:two-component system, NarL family, nitrate/nitrite response regulator NarL
VPSLDFVAEAGVAASPHSLSETEAGGRPHLALVDPSRLRRDCLKLAVCSEGWRVTDVPAVRDLVRRLVRGEGFDAVLIGATSGASMEPEQIARLVAAAPRIPILVAIDCENSGQAEKILSAGARGIVPAGASLRMLMSALARIRGGASLPSDRTRSGTGQSGDTPMPCALTRRQNEVLALLSEGQSNKLIAASLCVSEETVKAHVKQIIKRLKVANRTQAALVATRANGHSVPPLGRRLAGE